MRITAAQIADWATGREAEETLPLLVRRLIHRSARLAAIMVPGGDQIGRPGWDGIVHAVEGSAWVPVGASYWELSRQADVRAKANADYQKRLEQTDPEIRRKSCFVFVSAHNWPRKTDWQAEKQASGDWGAVRVYDADDLEQWLEQTPEVALWFGELLGLHGPGVESLERLWSGWAGQTRRPITVEAFLAGREEFAGRLREQIATGEGPVTLRADSVEEASAFAAAVLLDRGEGRDQTLVLTDADGWRHVRTNPEIKIVIAARPEHAQNPVRRPSLRVVLPVARGNPPAPAETDPILERPLPGRFERALIDLGHDPADADRLERHTGRSWTIYRRIEARNAAIRRPGWLDHPAAGALLPLCLVGSWSSTHEADRAVIAAIAGRDAEAIERDLAQLAELDDAPVLRLGPVWQVKSPLELLQLYGQRLLSRDLDRYFDQLRRITQMPDPVLELLPEERWLAGIHSKERAESGRLIRALLDSLVKLAVLGERLPALQSAQLPMRAAGLVRDLLAEADATRWLSLAGMLSALAEAAPSAFLDAVEQSLDRPDQPVTRLLRETSGSDFTDRSWHADLLWALEILAWDPRHLPRVALVLARLVPIEIRGNWGNTPLGSLASLFRPWLPQTSAPLDRRMAALDRVIAFDQEIGWRLLVALTFRDPGHASPNARPKWRDTDAGAGHEVPQAEVRPMLTAAVDRLLALAPAGSNRLADLVHHADWLGPEQRDRLWEMLETFAETAMDAERPTLSKALRHYLHLQSLQDEAEADSDRRDRAEALLRKFQPVDPALRFSWLFEAPWIDLAALPVADLETRLEHQTTLRCRAVVEVLDLGGRAGLDQLIDVAAAPEIVGRALAGLNMPVGDLADWLLDHVGTWNLAGKLPQAFRGLLTFLAPNRREALVRTILGRLPAEDQEGRVDLLLLCPCDRTSWTLLAEAGESAETRYWRLVQPGWQRHEPADLQTLIDHLLLAGRPLSAFSALTTIEDQIDPERLLQLLDALGRGDEPDGPMPGSWEVDRAIGHVEAASIVPRRVVASLEFSLFPLVKGGERRAHALMQELASDPTTFVELLSLAYYPASGPDASNEVGQATAARADEVLSAFTLLPGTRDDGSIDEAGLAAWIIDVQQRCAGADRTTLGDRRIGHLLAHAPMGADGIWPCEAVRGALERLGSPAMADGFFIGTLNKRGMTSRDPFEGGDQERRLAERFAADAETLGDTHPVMAEALAGLAEHYRAEAAREDEEMRRRLDR